MPADRRRALWSAPLATLLLVTGCASMPDTGSVEKVTESPRTDAESQVRIIGVKPQKDDDPMAVVHGFLEATTSDEANYDTARLYLAKETAKEWNPEAGITVLTGSPLLRFVNRREPAPDASAQIDLSGDKAAAVDSKHAYKPDKEAYHATFSLKKERGQWRIKDLPNGLVFSQPDFQRVYRSVNMYYFAATADPDVLVPDPVYLRKGIDPIKSAVRSLLDGPTDWLSPVVASRIPEGTTLAGIELGDTDRLRVRLNGLGGTPERQCEWMAAQVLRTVQEEAATKVKFVELADENDKDACALTERQAREYDPLRAFDAADKLFFVDAEHRLRSLEQQGGGAVQVPGPFGDGRVGLRYVAVRSDGKAAAGVRRDGKALYLADFQDGAELGKPVLTSKAAKPDDGLAQPSWDGLGDLWVADRDPKNARLLVLRDGQQITVDVPDLAKGRVQALRVAPDGARIALLVREGDRTVLQLGRVERRQRHGDPEISVKDLRQVAPQLEDVAAASWAGLSRLLVVGQESEGVRQMQYVDTDGSMPFAPTLPAISGVNAVATSPDQAQPILADTSEGIYQLPPDANWKRVAPKGSSFPVYPG
ncbi:LpqB family beta-propeller domain-containing protein [Wenjunlia tyrosinilytica]|uniref:Lipoprotein LpqB n=1 Tax=Wenjunlia tyrosinilytica TaxID=1544741 RepID=A0A918E0J3_9ACTN|nr:LpqB family beta-propeller domain-containing protein [Wenjunlia tyrosinilytica]GGO97342.1 lipoprotein LpqB [Wenjunlia tyrosinilytica]